MPNIARQAIVTRFFGPTNTRGPRIRASCDRGSIVIPFPHELDGQAAHDSAVQALLNRFSTQDGNDKSFGSLEDYAAGALPSSAKDAYVYVSLSSPSHVRCC